MYLPGLEPENLIGFHRFGANDSVLADDHWGTILLGRSAWQPRIDSADNIVGVDMHVRHMDKSFGPVELRTWITLCCLVVYDLRSLSGAPTAPTTHSRAAS